jgi:hypothetical protein
VAVEHLDFLQLALIDFQEFDGQTLIGFLRDLLPHYFVIFSQVLRLPGVRQDLALPVLVRTIAVVMIGSVFTEIVVQESDVRNLPMPVAVGDEWIDGLVTIIARGMSAPDRGD